MHETDYNASKKFKLKIKDTDKQCIGTIPLFQLKQ